MVKVELDTSVFVAALLSDSGASARIMGAVRSRQIHPVTTNEMIDEVRDVLGREKFRLSREKQNAFVRLLLDASLVMTPLDQFRVERCRDPQDDTFLSLANQVGANYLISLDHDLIELKKIGVTKIVTPGDFLKEVGDSL